MRFNRVSLMVMIFGLLFLLSSTASAGRRVRTFGSKKTESTKTGKKKSKGKEKPFSELTKDKVKIEGLFTFYHDTTDNSMLMEITPEQIGPIYLCGMARATGDGTFFDTGPIGRSFPFYFKRVGKKILMMEKNLRLRADTASTMYSAVKKGISDHLFASVEVKSKPEDSTKSILVDPASIFIRDAENISYYLGQRAKTGISFDKGNSYFYEVKSFPLNTELEVKLHFKSSKWNSGPTLQNGQSFFHTYHYSLSALPESDYVPRIADDRIGYFVTMYQDYTNLDTESPYVRYIERWHLKKKNPNARISEPEKPIVYWIENTVPEEYRDAIAEGIEFWNQSFEKLGYRNAVIAKQMPDTADWDPLDVRYSTIRWMVSPRIYAIGPSRANPFTGEVYDADISVSVDFIRIMFNNMANFIAPISFDGILPEESKPIEQPAYDKSRFCNYGKELAEEASFGLNYLLSTTGSFADKDSLTREYVHSYIVELVAHEVGHTLGFRHNFKASSIYNLQQLQDRSFTRQHGMVGTVMDYTPPNIAPIGQPQGEFFMSAPGPYDDWVVEYGYTDYGAEKPEDEIDQLQTVASRSTEPGLAYATDFDLGYYSVDPMVNLFDLGDDPLAYCVHKMNLTRELWDNAIKKFEKPGESFEKIRRVFAQGWRSYYESAIFAAHYVGGLTHNKHHVAKDGGTIPFTPTTASDQRRAMKLLRDYIFAPDAFKVPADLLNKLQSPQQPDFSYSIYSTPLLYPWHQRVLSIQQIALNGLYNQQTISKLLNNLDRYRSGDKRYTMEDMFTETRRAIWTEIVGPSNVNNHRRELQLAHLNWIIAIYLSSSRGYPTDARTLAAHDLDVLQSAAKSAVNSSAINSMTKAHFKEVLRQIEAARGAKRSYSMARQQVSGR